MFTRARSPGCGAVSSAGAARAAAGPHHPGYPRGSNRVHHPHTANRPFHAGKSKKAPSRTAETSCLSTGCSFWLLHILRDSPCPRDGRAPGPRAAHAAPAENAPGKKQHLVFPGVVLLIPGGSILQMTNHSLNVRAAQHVSG